MNCNNCGSNGIYNGIIAINMFYFSHEWNEWEKNSQHQIKKHGQTDGKNNFPSHQI